ncbi:hypothetical protein ACQKP8_15230 [Photobacterium alginatilyticum]|uniref:hypothetical protein n=1 Tax=Photobacterium alginatilyticum TaxID=1775171 RepID=UPI0040676F91
MFQNSEQHLIQFCLNDLDSLRHALAQYRVLLDANDVMGKNTFNIEFVEASVEPSRRLQVADAQHNIELLKSSLDLGQEGGPHYYPDHIDDDNKSPISEPIFFAIALQYPELRTEVVEAVQAIVRYARRHNNTNNMWLDNMRLFGAEAIYMLARSDIRYAYLMAQFYIPYWDNEHATGYEGYFCDLLARHGWGEAMIKAFIWCDNPAFRHAMNTCHIDPNKVPPALGEHLLLYPEAYEHFVQMLQQRFTQQPVMLATSNDKLDSQNPVVDIYLSAFAEWEPYSDIEQTELLQRQAWGSTLKEVAYDMQHRIEEQLNVSLVCYAESTLTHMARYEAYCERIDNPISAISLLDEMASLIKHLPNGTALWHYVNSGEGFQHLKTFDPLDLETTSVWPIAQAFAPTFYLHMLDECDDEECDYEIHYQLLNVLKPILDIWITNNKDKDTSSRLEGRDRFIRLLDVWYHILGQRDLTQRHFLAVAATNNPPSITPKEFYARYTQETSHTDESTLPPRLKKQVSTLFSQFDEPSSTLYRDSLRAVSLIMSEQRATHDPAGWKPTLACCTLAAHLWYQDHLEKRQDAYTENLFDFIDEHFFTAVIKRLIGNGTKALQNHRDSLTQFVHQTNSQIDFDTIVNLLRTHLRTVKGTCQTDGEHCINDQQPTLELFEKKGSMQNVSLTCAWLASYDNPLQERARQLLLLLQALAPQRVMAHLAYSRSCSRVRIAFEAPQLEHYAFNWLHEVGIAKCHIDAFKMAQA